jgi:hypothetical protein
MTGWSDYRVRSDTRITHRQQGEDTVDVLTTGTTGMSASTEAWKTPTP